MIILILLNILVEECKADPNIKDNDGWTPLHYASYNGHLDIVKYLVEKGKADPIIENKYGSTPLIVATINGHPDIVKYLVEECKVDPNIKNDDGETPLKLAKNGMIPYDPKRDKNTIRKGKKGVANYLTNITQK